MLSALVTLLLAQELARLDRLVELPNDVQAHYVSSHDRSGGNDDGFNGTYSALYVDERGEHVIVDAVGPGTLYNLWFTSRENGRAPLGWGRIKFYFDGEAEPRIDMNVDALYRGRHPPFRTPFVYHAFQSTGGYVSYLPLPFNESLKITTEHRVGFYNAYYHTYAPDRVVTTWTGAEDMRALESLWSRPGVPPRPAEDAEIVSGTIALGPPEMPDGEPVPSRTVLFERDGPGIVAALRLNPLFPLTAYQLQHIVVRAYWDGESEPSIDAPLGSFFGSGLGEADVRAVPIGMSPSGPYYCHLPMPFWRAARLELVNENPDATPPIWWQATIEPNEHDPSEAGYLTAHYRREWPTTLGEDYRILEASGRGLYLGQVMTVEPLRAELKRWWEGDLRIYLDGRRHPAFHGTGHEDEYLGGWSNEWLMNPYSLPMHGEPKTTELTQVDFQWSAATTVYRFFVGGIPFHDGIRVSTEHGARNTANAMYSSVAYYYRHRGAMELLGSVDDGRARFTLSVPNGYDALRLRRRFDPKRAQKAEVRLSGRLVGVWYSPEANEHASQVDSDFLLPAHHGDTLTIEIRPVDDAWQTHRYELWGIRQ